MSNRIKNNSGITLTALVVTIILMLILAGVTLSLTIGDDGVVNQTINAREDQAKAVYKEIISVEVAAEKIKGTNNTQKFLENVRTRLLAKDEFKDHKGMEIKRGNALYITTQEGYKFIVQNEEVIIAEGSMVLPEDIKVSDIEFTKKPTVWDSKDVEITITTRFDKLKIEYTDDYRTEDWREYTTPSPLISVLPNILSSFFISSSFFKSPALFATACALIASNSASAFSKSLYELL